jgi:hypothetical protein
MELKMKRIFFVSVMIVLGTYLSFAQFVTGNLTVNPDNPEYSSSIGGIVFSAKPNIGKIIIGESESSCMLGCTLYMDGKFAGNVDISTKNYSVTRTRLKNNAVTIQTTMTVVNGTYNGANVKVITQIVFYITVNPA